MLAQGWQVDEWYHPVSFAVMSRFPRMYEKPLEPEDEVRF